MKPLLLIICLFFWGTNGPIEYDNSAISATCPPSVEIIQNLSCIECDCITEYEGYYMFQATYGYTTYNWSVSGGTIVYDFNDYIYVSKPGGGWLGVSVAAFKSGCDWHYDYWGVNVEDCD